MDQPLKKSMRIFAIIVLILFENVLMLGAFIHQYNLTDVSTSPDAFYLFGEKVEVDSSIARFQGFRDRLETLAEEHDLNPEDDMQWSEGYRWELLDSPTETDREDTDYCGTLVIGPDALYTITLCNINRRETFSIVYRYGDPGVFQEYDYLPYVFLTECYTLLSRFEMPFEDLEDFFDILYIPSRLEIDSSLAYMHEIRESSFGVLGLYRIEYEYLIGEVDSEWMAFETLSLHGLIKETIYT